MKCTDFRKSNGYSSSKYVLDFKFLRLFVMIVWSRNSRLKAPVFHEVSQKIIRKKGPVGAFIGEKSARIHLKFTKQNVEFSGMSPENR